MALIKKSIVLILIFLVILFGGAAVYSSAESWNYVDSLYFTAVSLTTIGYGDFAPLTNFGKIFTVFFSIVGISVTFLLITIIGRHVFQEVFEESLKKHQRNVLKQIDQRRKPKKR